MLDAANSAADCSELFKRKCIIALVKAVSIRDSSSLEEMGALFESTLSCMMCAGFDSVKTYPYGNMLSNIDNVSLEDFSQLARSAGVAEGYLLDMAVRMRSALESHFDEAAGQLLSRIGDSASELSERIWSGIEKRASLFG